MLECPIVVILSLYPGLRQVEDSEVSWQLTQC